MRTRRFGMLARWLGLVGTLTVLASGTACMEEADSWKEGVLLRPNGDVLAAGGVVDLNETLSGDAMMVGSSVTFDGSAGGSFVGAAGDHRVRGRIAGSVRAVGGTVLVGASVGRNVTVAGGSVELEDAAVVEGNAYIAGGNVRLLGRVDGDVYIGGRDVLLDGAVGGDVRVEARTLRVGPDARIEGELRYRIEEDGPAAIATDALVGGGVQALEPREGSEGDEVGFFVLRLLAFMLCGVVLVALLPNTLAETSREMRARPGAALGLGLLWLLLVPLGVVITAVTVVGIPIALIVAVLYGVTLYLAPVVPALWVGGEILHGRDPTERGDAALLFLTGGAIVAFAILLPWLGFLARLLTACLGLGAAVLMVRDRRSAPKGGTR